VTDPPRILSYMGIETTGKLHTIFDTKQVSERFTKREFVIELADNPKYPQMVLFQLTGDRVTQLDDMRVGDEVRIEFSLRGREWRSPNGEVKYFNSLDVWKIEPARAGRSAGGGNGRSRSNSQGGDPRDMDMIPRAEEQYGRVDNDDIPF
jgi:single-strand DNA-binding protein